MNILHISDLHYNGTSQPMETVLAKIVETLVSHNKKVDFILFTGDLVYSATVKSHFITAKQKLFDYLCHSLNVPSENVIFCPGNHDIDRSRKHPAIKPYFEQEVNTMKELDEFYQKKNVVYQDSLRTLDNYTDFAKSYHLSEDDVFNDLYSVHYRKYNNDILAFVCIYTPWLSAIWDDKGDTDEGNLCYPISTLEEILKSVEGKSSRRILLMHHPIGALRKNIAFEVEERVYNGFEMLFAGHIHKMMNVARHTGWNGIYEHSAKATLTKSAEVGCSFIENVDYEPNKFIVSEITFVKDSNECHFGSAVEITIPVGTEKAEQIRLRSKVHSRVEIEMRNANNLLLQNDTDDENAFLSKYSIPYIKTQREDTANSYVTPSVQISELYAATSNYIIYGRDKCGKTSLLRRIQLEYLMNYSTYQKIPLYLDAKQEASQIDNKYDIEQKLRNYLEINTKQVRDITNSDKFVLLIDNFRPNDAFCNYLTSFVKIHVDCILLITTDDNLSNSIEIEGLNIVKEKLFNKVYFHNLRRQEIIKYTEDNLSEKEDKSEIQEKILRLCKQMELPFNYWTISLFLLIHHKSADAYSKNLFAILDYCVDEIFDKKKFLVQGAQVTFSQIKQVTASLAAYLFIEHEDTVYSATESDILFFLTDEFHKNVRINTRPKTVFDFLMDCGMLKSHFNGYYSFRLNGFFEYFLAYHMTKDTGFRERILTNDVEYLGFRNQLEIYSGLKNDDGDTLRRVYEKTVAKCEPLFSNYKRNIDEQLKDTVIIPQKLEEDLKNLSVQKSLTPIQKAAAEDTVEGGVELRSDVHLMNKLDPSSNKIDVVERYISILARVYKNIDNVAGGEIDIIQIFRAIIDYYCKFGFYLVENIADETKELLSKDDICFIDETDEMKLLKMMTYMSPVMAQTFLYDGIGHYSLIRLLKMEIDTLREAVGTNQYRLFVLYFTLFDIALSENYKMIDQAISDISKIPILRYMVYLKLNYYLAFKSSGNNQLANYLQDKATKVKMMLNDKTDIDRLQQALSDTRKTSMITKS